MSNVRRCDRVSDVKSANEVEAIITTVYSIVYRNKVFKVSCRSSKTRGPILRRRLQFPQRFPQNLGVSEMKENCHPGSRKSLKTEVFLGFTPQLPRRNRFARIKWPAGREAGGKEPENPAPTS